MAEKLRIILDENQDLVRVEANIDGVWSKIESKQASADSGTQTMEAACGTGTANCAAVAGLCVYEYAGECFYYTC